MSWEEAFHVFGKGQHSEKVVILHLTNLPLGMRVERDEITGNEDWIKLKKKKKDHFPKDKGESPSLRDHMEGVCVTQRATRATTWETTIYIRDRPPPPKAHPSLGTTFSVSQLMHAYPHGRDTPKKSMPWEIFAPSSKPSQPHACRIPTWVITSAWRLLILAQSMQRPAEVADSSPPFPLHMDASTL